LAHLGAMLAHLAAYVGPCWPILGHKSRKMGTAKNTVKWGSFWWYAVIGGRGGGPLSPSERRELPYGKDGQLRAPRAPGRISAYARQPARGSTILPPSCGYVGLCGQCGPSLGLCWPSLGLCWPILKAVWADLEAYVGPFWPMLSQKIRKMGTAKKHSCGYVGLCWPILELCWPILRAMWAHLGAMLAHLGPI